MDPSLPSQELFHPATFDTLLPFVCIVLTLVVLGVVSIWRSHPRWQALLVSLMLLAWLSGFTVFVGSHALLDGKLDGLPVPPIVATFGIINGMSLLAALSPVGRRLAEHFSLAALVGFQGFRLPLELVLHAWVQQGTIPVTMSWNLSEGGHNLDILTGIVALLAGLMLWRRPELRSVAWAANLLGLALLINVGRVAVLSSPVPFGWNVKPPLMLIAYLPYAYIGPVCVGGALFGHVVLTRKLLKKE